MAELKDAEILNQIQAKAIKQQAKQNQLQEEEIQSLALRLAQFEEQPMTTASGGNAGGRHLQAAVAAAPAKVCELVACFGPKPRKMRRGTLRT